MSDPQSFIVSVVFKGSTKPLSLPPSVREGSHHSHSMQDLAEGIAAVFDIAPEQQRVIYKGKKIDIVEYDNDDAIPFPSGSKVMLLQLASSEAITHLNTESKISVRIIDDMGGGSSGVKKYGMKKRVTEATQRKSEYGFGRINPLMGFKDNDVAHEFLTALSTDRRVAAVMDKYKWFVPTLSELMPDGKVGVDPVCVMGLNKNNGMEILLRLRTDDLQGFRRYDSVLEVLWHELAHNRISEHNAEFFALMREIEKEGNKLDWTRSAGRTTGGSLDRHLPAPATSEEDSLYDYSTGYEGGAYKLGGGEGDDLGSLNLSKREKLALAALRRVDLTEKERVITHSCSTGHAHAPPPTSGRDTTAPPTKQSEAASSGITVTLLGPAIIPSSASHTVKAIESNSVVARHTSTSEGSVSQRPPEVSISSPAALAPVPTLPTPSSVTEEDTVLQEKVILLMSMGFDHGESVKAIKGANGDVNLAISRLV